MAARFSCTFTDRSFSPVLGTETLKFYPQRFSRAAQWGPKACEIAVEGDERGLFALFDWLRYGVTVRDEVGDACWWGFVQEVEVTIGKYTFGLSLDTMANNIAVAYNQILAGQTSSGDRATTNWAQDDISVITFGTKELLITMSDARDDQADRYRNTALAVSKEPSPTIKLSGANGLKATLHCVGWHRMLEWRYYVNAGEGAQFTSYITYGLNPLYSRDVVAYGQTFQLGGLFGCRLTTIQIRASKFGSPSGSMKMDLYTDGGTGTGTLLGTVSVAVSSLAADGSAGWVAFDFTGQNIKLAGGTTYWIVLTATGTGVGNDVIWWASNSNGYGGGTGKYAPTASWLTAAWDLYFKVDGDRDTTDAFKDIVTAYGQGIYPSVVVPTASGVYGSAYGDGDLRALKVLENLLETGTTGSLRMLAFIGPDRSIALEPEPGDPKNGYGVSYLLNADGEITNAYEIPIAPWKCPCGGWARIMGVIPAAASGLGITRMKHVFIEEAEYDVASNALSLTPRGQPNIFDLSGVRS